MSTVVSKRLRRLRGRKDLHTSQVPVPPLPAPRQSPNDSGQPQLPPGGALAYLADYDVHRAKIYGRCEAMTGIASFTALVEQVMTQEPYVSADGVFWVVNNGSSHRGQKGIDRVAEQFPNAVMVHTPVHASWLNQVKVYLSIIQRKALSPKTSPTSTLSSNASPDSRSATPQRPNPSNGSSPPTTLRSPGTPRPTTRSPNPRRRRSGGSLFPDELTNLTSKVALSDLVLIIDSLPTAGRGPTVVSVHHVCQLGEGPA